MRVIGRIFRAIVDFFTGKTDQVAEQIEANPHAMNAKYDGVVRGKRMRMTQYLDAVAQVLVILERKRLQYKKAVEDEANAERRRIGATTMLQSRTKELQAAGKTKEQILTDKEFLRIKSDLTGFQTREKELEAEITRLEEEIAGFEANIEDHKRNANQMKREIEAIMAEKGEAVAEVITNQEQERANKLLAGISDDSTGESLDQLRDLRSKSRARVKASDLVSGNEQRRADAAYDAAAASADLDGELDALLFGSNVAEPAPADKAEKSGVELSVEARLPE